MRNFFCHNICFLSRYGKGITAVLVGMIFSAVVSSCGSGKVITKEVPVLLHDTITDAKYLHDSIFVDNFVKEYVKGDTVFTEKTSTKYVERILTDTVRVIEKVPIETTVEVEKVVEKPLDLKWWQELFIWLGVLFTAFVVVYGGINCLFSTKQIKP